MNTEDLPASLEVTEELKKLVEYVTGGANTVYLSQDGRSVAVLLDIDLYNALLDAADSPDDAFENNSDAGIMADILKQYRYRSQTHQA
ncbi:MAG: hypothetical protein JW909_10695 [Planctomycetes bacterium]|nr:hypothetical protein [Planctomycetota bacterium]